MGRASSFSDPVLLTIEEAEVRSMVMKPVELMGPGAQHRQEGKPSSWPFSFLWLTFWENNKYVLHEQPPLLLSVLIIYFHHFSETALTKSTWFRLCTFSFLPMCYLLSFGINLESRDVSCSLCFHQCLSQITVTGSQEVLNAFLLKEWITL